MSTYDEMILLETINALSMTLDDLISACHGSSWEIIAPSKKEIMKARAMLPKKYKNSLEKISASD